MKLRDDHQRALVCRTLLRQVRRESLWTVAGPTEQARELFAQEGGALSAGERIILKLAWTIWGEDGGVRVEDLFRLKSDVCVRVSELIGAMAQGPDAVDAWLQRYA